MIKLDIQISWHKLLHRHLYPGMPVQGGWRLVCVAVRGDSCTANRTRGEAPQTTIGQGVLSHSLGPPHFPRHMWTRGVWGAIGPRRRPAHNTHRLVLATGCSTVWVRTNGFQSNPFSFPGLGARPGCSTILIPLRR